MFGEVSLAELIRGLRATTNTDTYIARHIEAIQASLPTATDDQKVTPHR
jgi:hypothetical protein